MVFLIIFGVLCTVVLLMYANWYRYARSMKGITGPVLYPIVGNAHQFKSTQTFLPTIEKLLEQNNKTVRVALGPHFFVFTSDVKFIELFLTSNEEVNKSSNYKYLYNWLGEGLLTSGGMKWKRSRKLITPAYHFQILEQFVEVFDKNGDIFLENLEKYEAQGSVNLHPLVSLFTLDVICESAMGTGVGAQKDQDSQYVKSVKNLCNILMERSFSAVQSNSLLYLFTSNYQIEKQSLKVVNDYTLKVIRSRREVLIHNNNLKTGKETGEVKRKLAFLDLLLKSTVDGRSLSDEEIREEVNTFMFAGHDTTSSAITFALFCLAEHPEIQQKVLEEQYEIFADGLYREITYDDLHEMKYLEMVIKETLRLYPPVPAIGRQIQKDLKFSEDITFKAGCNIGIVQFLVHRNPEIFPDPEKFDPERFSPEHPHKGSSYFYIPFSAGPRNCIGQKFAMLEMKSAISKVIRNYKLSPVVPRHKLQLSSEVTLQSTNGVLVKINKRL